MIYIYTHIIIHVCILGHHQSSTCRGMHPTWSCPRRPPNADNMSDTMPDKMTNRAPHNMSARMSEYTYVNIYIYIYLPDKMSDRVFVGKNARCNVR